MLFLKERVIGNAWAAQFRDAFIPGADRAPEEHDLALPPTAYLLHYSAVTWKFLLAFLPPAQFGHGVPCFICTLGVLSGVRMPAASLMVAAERSYRRRRGCTWPRPCKRVAPAGRCACADGLFDTRICEPAGLHARHQRHDHGYVSKKRLTVPCTRLPRHVAGRGAIDRRKLHYYNACAMRDMRTAHAGDS